LAVIWQYWQDLYPYLGYIGNNWQCFWDF